MLCTHCHYDLPEKSNFCPQCGAATKKICQKCHAEEKPESKFCSNCGNPFSQSNTQPNAVRTDSVSPTSTPVSGKAEFSSSTPADSLLKQVAATPEAAAPSIAKKRMLQGEKKYVSILFVDMCGSTEMIRNCDPEEARSIEEPILTIMMQSVYRYGGTVIKAAGDSIMALFGAPIAYEDHALRACLAALAMRTEINKSNNNIKVRVGINSGNVVVDMIGNDQHKEYDAIGSAVNLAARMEQSAAPNTIQITDEVQKSFKRFLQTKSLGFKKIKGFENEIEIFELESISYDPFKGENKQHPISKFVGRKKELKQIKLLKNRVISEGACYGIGICGEPGQGKSRLIQEALNQLELVNWTTLRGQSMAIEMNTTLLPIVAQLNEYLHIDENSDIEAILSSKLTALDPNLIMYLPAFYALYRLPLNQFPEWINMDPMFKKQNIFEALYKFFISLSEVQPLLLVIEDLHWVDDETKDFINKAFTRFANSSILLLFSYRPEYQNRWPKTRFNEIRLPQLKNTQINELMNDLIGTDRSLDQLKKYLVKSAGGNPFFLEESISSLKEEGILTTKASINYSLSDTDTLKKLVIPARIQTVIAARIDRLSTEEKKILQTMAIIGREATYPIIAKLLEFDMPTLINALQNLQKNEFIYQSRIAPLQEFNFRHALIRDVAENSLLKTQKKYLYTELVKVIEEIYADNLDEYVDRLGFYAMQGEDWQKAFDYNTKAADRSLTYYCAIDACKRFYQQALLASKHLPDEIATLTKTFNIYINLFNVTFAREGDYKSAHQYVEPLKEVAAQLPEKYRGEVMPYESMYYIFEGDVLTAIDQVNQGIIFDKGGFGEYIGKMHLVYCYFMLGEYHKAIEVGETVLKEAPHLTNINDPHDFPVWLAMSFFLSSSYDAIGDTNKIKALMSEILTTVDAPKTEFAKGFEQGALGIYYLSLGNPKKAISALSYTRRPNTRATVGVIYPITAAALACAYSMIGDKEKAHELLAEIFPDNKPMVMRGFQSMGIKWVCKTYRLLNEQDKFNQFAKMQLEFARKHHLEGLENIVKSFKYGILSS